MKYILCVFNFENQLVIYYFHCNVFYNKLKGINFYSSVRNLQKLIFLYYF